MMYGDDLIFSPPNSELKISRPCNELPTSSLLFIMYFYCLSNSYINCFYRLCCSKYSPSIIQHLPVYFNTRWCLHCFIDLIFSIFTQLFFLFIFSNEIKKKTSEHLKLELVLFIKNIA